MVMELYNDFNTSVEKALDEITPHWREYNGILICGTHSPQNWQEQIEALRVARETGLPTLGICFGFQLMAIEYARNVLGIKDATSQELEDTGTFVVYKLSELNVGLKDGESYWNNYTVDGGIAQKMKDIKHPHYVGVQYHPEYQSSKEKPHPILVNFISACKNGSVE